MSVDALIAANDCLSCGRKDAKIWRHATDLRLCPATEPLVYVSIELLGSPLESNNGNTALLWIVGRFRSQSEAFSYAPQRYKTSQRPSKSIGVFCMVSREKSSPTKGSNLQRAFPHMCVAYSVFSVSMLPLLTHKCTGSWNDSNVLFLQASVNRSRQPGRLGWIYARTYICPQYPAAQRHWISSRWTCVSTPIPDVGHQKLTGCHKQTLHTTMAPTVKASTAGVNKTDRYQTSKCPNLIQAGLWCTSLMQKWQNISRRFSIFRIVLGRSAS